ncbi:MAG: hypothetical protein K2X11_16735 [Acetobacteraceae bacterium]|nr:hypothetical protein [Acetobacteraceae bacterium]
MIRRRTLAGLALLLVAMPPARAETELWRDGAQRLVLRDGAVLALSGERVLARAPAAQAQLLGLAEPRGQRVVIVVAEAEGRRTVLGYGLGGSGLIPAGAVPVGPGEIPLTPLLAPDPVFVGAGPAVPLRLLAGRLVTDAEALAAPVAEAMGAARCPGGPHPATVEDAARLLRGLPAEAAVTQATRLVACLVYAGRPFEARRLLGYAFPPAESQRPRQVEERVARLLACSPHVQAVRRASPPEKTFLQERCRLSS